MMTHAQARYQEVDLLTMSPARRVVFLYTQILVNLRFAQALTEPARLEERTNRIAKAQQIVHELLATLDHEAGGQIAASLASLYAYWLQELVSLSIRRDDTRLAALITLVAELHGAWDEAAKATPDAAGRGAA